MSREARAIVVITFLFVMGGTPIGAQTGEQSKPAPKLAFGGRPKPLLRLVDGSQLATATVVLTNSGTANADGVTFLLLEDNSVPVEACGVRDLTAVGTALVDDPCANKPEPVALAAGATKRFAITVRVPRPAGLRDPLVEARSSVAGVTPVVGEVTVSRSFSEARLWWPLYVAGAAAGVFLVCGIFATLGAKHRDPPKGLGVLTWARAKVFTESAWSFKDSWLTNIAALGGVLGTVLGATGFFNEVLPGVSAGRFTGFSLVFGGLALVAPIVYTTLGTRHATSDGNVIAVGTVAGLLVASTVTISAVAGQLMALAMLTHMSDASDTFQALCFVGLIAGGLTVGVYAVRSARWLSIQPAPKASADTDDSRALQPLGSAASGYAVSSAGAL